MTSYRRKTPGAKVDAVFCPEGAVRTSGTDTIFDGRQWDTEGPVYAVFHDDRLWIVSQARFDREYERVEEERKEWVPGPGAREVVFPAKEKSARSSWHRCPWCNEVVGGKVWCFYDGKTDAYYHGKCYDAMRNARKRKEEKSGRATTGHCWGCGKVLYIDETCAHSEDGHLRCRDCHSVFAAKKPSPLTLADLKPGDVFKWYEDLEPMQFLVSPRTLYSADKNLGRFVPEVGLSQPIIYLRHHNLTPKQLLWVNATPEERQALEESIGDKWLPIMRGEKRDGGARDCPCCRQAKSRCEHCIIGRHDISILARSCGGGLHTTTVRGGYQAKRAFTLGLAEFLPNIHPLRIEVEATPVEWAGKK